MELDPFLYSDLLDKKTLICGPPGCGKTTLLNNIKSAIYNEFNADNRITIDRGVPIDNILSKKLNIIQQFVLPESRDRFLCTIDDAYQFTTRFPYMHNFTLVISTQYLDDICNADDSLKIDFDYIFMTKKIGSEDDKILHNCKLITDQLDRYQFAVFRKMPEQTEKYKICNIVETFV